MAKSAPFPLLRTPYGRARSVSAGLALSKQVFSAYAWGLKLVHCVIAAPTKAIPNSISNQESVNAAKNSQISTGSAFLTAKLCQSMAATIPNSAVSPLTMTIPQGPASNAQGDAYHATTPTIVQPACPTSSSTHRHLSASKSAGTARSITFSAMMATTTTETDAHETAKLKTSTSAGEALPKLQTTAGRI